MIFPYWVGDKGVGMRSVWPLLLMIAINIAIFQLVLSDLVADVEKLYNYIAEPSLTFSHLVLSGFLHLGYGHLLGNMWFLWLFGQPLAAGLSARFFFGLYFTSGVAATLTNDLITNEPVVGASGAVAGMMGFFVTHFMRNPMHCLLLIIPVILPAWLIVGVFIGMDVYGVYSNEEYVAHWAHLGGMATGIAAGLLVLRHDNRVHRR